MRQVSVGLEVSESEALRNMSTHTHDALGVGVTQQAMPMQPLSMAAITETSAVSKATNRTAQIARRMGAGLLMVGVASAYPAHAGEQYVSAQLLDYKESDDRIKVDYSTFSLLKDFGVDFTLSANYSEDEITGATPVWTDETSGASPRMAVTETGMISQTPHASLEDFQHVNAEMEDKRTAGDISLTWRTPERRDELTVGVNKSKEEDYKSRGLSVNYLHHLDDSKNRSLSMGVSVLDNEALFPRVDDWRSAKYYTAQLGLTQVLSPTAVVDVAGYVMRDEGALSNPYQTVIRSINIGSDTAPQHRLFLAPDKRPDSRNIVGIKVGGVKRLEQTIADQPVTINGSYRLYQDDWGQTAHTLESQAYIGDLDDKGRLMLGARVSNQSEANFYKAHDSEDKIFNIDDYATSDERMGDMTSISVQAGYEYRFADHWHLLSQVAYEHQSTGLSFTWAGGGLRYDF